MSSGTISTNESTAGTNVVNIAHVHVDGTWSGATATLEYLSADTTWRAIVGQAYTANSDAFISVPSRRLRLTTAGGTDETIAAQTEANFDGLSTNGSFNGGDGSDGNETIAAQNELNFDGAGDNGTFVAGNGASSSSETIAAQDETNFTGGAPNGSFVGGDGAGGTAYVVGEVIGLVDGTIITVDAIDGNDDATEFTVTSKTTKQFDSPSVVVLAQVTSTGSGLGFVLTVDTNNVVNTTGYIAADTITMSDGSVITVDVVDVDGDITDFTVTSKSTTPFDDTVVTNLLQASTSGVGIGFIITLGANNTADSSVYVGTNTITMSDGSVITVNTVVAGDVTEFTVTTKSTGDAGGAGGVLTQVSTTGVGLGFTMTLGAANVVAPSIFWEIK